jgi:hypothetical protein
MMANHETLADRAVSMAGAIAHLEEMLKGVNDYGDSTAYCAEADQIANDAHAQLGMLRSRAYALKRRWMLAEAEKSATAGAA